MFKTRAPSGSSDDDKLEPYKESDAEYALLDETSRRRIPSRAPPRPWTLIAANLVLFVASLITAGWNYSAWHRLRTNHGNELIRIMDWYSPLHDEIQINLMDKKVNGTLLNIDHSLFRSPPSPEVDAAWERIGNLNAHAISTDAVIRLGKDPAVTARFSADWGFGDDAHVVELDVMHTIHCLNAIRRDVHWKHYFADRYPDGVFPDLHRVHTDHCIYIVLQNLMCSATADIVTQPWVVGQSHPFPDFNINKRCRDFGAILEWHERTMVTDLAKLTALRMPEGHTPLPMSDEFHALFGSADWDDHHGH